jgi:hypothetical protein
VRILKHLQPHLQKVCNKKGQLQPHLQLCNKGLLRPHFQLGNNRQFRPHLQHGNNARLFATLLLYVFHNHDPNTAMRRIHVAVGPGPPRKPCTCSGVFHPSHLKLSKQGVDCDTGVFLPSHLKLGKQGANCDTSQLLQRQTTHFGTL